MFAAQSAVAVGSYARVIVCNILYFNLFLENIHTHMCALAHTTQQWPLHCIFFLCCQFKENDERVARMKEMLSKGGGKPLILPTKPKPKPKPKPAPVSSEVSASSANGDSGLSSPSPDAHSVSVQKASMNTWICYCQLYIFFSHLVNLGGKEFMGRCEYYRMSMFKSLK